MGHILRRLFVTLFAFCGLVACSNRSQSEVAWAHYADTKLIGSIFGQLQLTQLKTSTRYQTLDVCVSSSSKTISVAEVLLESKLAFAMWLKAAGLARDENWSKFRFFSAANCDTKNLGLASYLVVGTQEKNLKDGSNDFAPATIDCIKQSGGLNCSTRGIVLGTGGPASYSWNSRDISSVRFVSLAGSNFSPYVDWLSLKNEISELSSVSAEVRDTIVSQYKNLLVAEDTPLDELLRLASLLETFHLVGRADSAFTSALPKTAAGYTGPYRYRPRRALFNTLLHEVGHQFGLDHADAPRAGDIVGPGLGERLQAAALQYTTSDATMAYGATYLFLTPDDVAGALNAYHDVARVFAKYP